MPPLQYNVEKPDRSDAEFEFLARKKEEEKVSQIAYVHDKLDKFKFQLDEMISVFVKIIANWSICNIFWKLKATNSIFLVNFCLFESRRVETLGITKTSFASLSQSGTLSCWTNNPENFSWKFHTICSVNLSIAKHLNNWSPNKNFRTKVEKIK